MTCKDCMHHDVCKKKHYHYANNKYRCDIDFIEKVCNFFKDKSKYIELPCKVGDVVYIIEPFNGICNMTLRNVRVDDVLKNNIFLTKSEAEQKLKELNANG